MKTGWIDETRLKVILARHEAFWRGELEDGPLMWVTVPDAKPGASPPVPQVEEEMWTNVDYYVASAEDQLSRTHYAGDALPVCHPWLGPDQVAAWLGAELTLKPKEFTSWVKPFVRDWSDYPELRIAPDNRWWKLYLELVRRCAEAGKDKWVTAYPDLHTGIDGLGAIRGPDNLMVDMVETPDTIQIAMRQMTQVWKDVVDTVSNIILPSGQGTSNWTMGWSKERFLCVGQNDFSCLLSPEMFEEFCLEDTRQTCDYADHVIYHLDGPDAVRHLPELLKLRSLDCIQWVQGAGKPLPSEWIGLLRRIQDAGKSVQVLYLPNHGGDANLGEELKVLRKELDSDRLFFWAIVDSVGKANELVEQGTKS